MTTWRPEICLQLDAATEHPAHLRCRSLHEIKPLIPACFLIGHSPLLILHTACTAAPSAIIHLVQSPASPFATQ
jgi:hypothetical protein